MSNMEDELYEPKKSTIVSVRLNDKEMRILEAIIRQKETTQSKVLKQALRNEGARLKIK